MNRIILVALSLLFLSSSSNYGTGLINYQNVSNIGGTRNMIVLKKGQPFASQLTQDNCIYVIRDCFDLKGSDSGKIVSIPANCVLRFEGGSLLNGIVSFSDTYLEGYIQLGVNCKGNIINKEGSLSWFTDGSINSSNLSWLLSNCYKTDIDKDIALDAPIDIGKHKVELYSSNNSIIRFNCKPSSYRNSTYYAWIISNGSSSISIHDIKLDFENKQYPLPKGNNNVYVCDAIRVVAPQMCSIYNVHVQNYGKTTGSLKYDSFCAIAIHPNGHSVIDVHDLLFNDIIVVGDGDVGVTQRGMGECLRIYYNNAGTEMTSPVTVYNISCINCFSVNTSGKPISDDFDCIHIDALDSNKRLTQCKINNCYFEGINKRAIKAQATNVHIDGVVYKNPNRIDGLTVLINPFGEKCVIENVYAFPNTNGNIISTRFSPEVTVSNCIISADPKYTYSSLTGIVDCRSISNCVIKNVSQAIVGFNNEIGIDGSTKNYWGEDNGTFDFAMNVIDNCRFENCNQVYVRRNSTQDRLKCKFINCSIYNSSYISVVNETEMIGCRINNDKQMEYELFTLFGKDASSRSEVNSLLIKDCIIGVNNNSNVFIMDRGVKALRHMNLAIDNSVISADKAGLGFWGRNTIRNGESLIEFDNFTIKDSRIDNYVLSIQKGWTGSISIINSTVPIVKGKITNETSFYNASLKGDSKIHLEGVKVQPDYNSLPLSSSVFSGQPASGTMFWQKGEPTWSNGTHWVDATGARVN